MASHTHEKPALDWITRHALETKDLDPEVRELEKLVRFPEEKFPERADFFYRVAWPFAICTQGGEGAYVGYIPYKKNKAAEEWIQQKIKGFPDGSEFIFTVGNPPKLQPKTSSEDN